MKLKKNYNFLDLNLNKYFFNLNFVKVGIQSESNAATGKETEKNVNISVDSVK